MVGLTSSLSASFMPRDLSACGQIHHATNTIIYVVSYITAQLLEYINLGRACVTATINYVNAKKATAVFGKIASQAHSSAVNKFSPQQVSFSKYREALNSYTVAAPKKQKSCPKKLNCFST
ncbi:hypothetical protein Ancab_007031 [Ancistrocladus abbreviatus]